ncbi:signal peptidase I [Patescibacteria group bacterium]|nr:signal peptidase I [Patescibacteria group bacterium]
MKSFIFLILGILLSSPFNIFGDSMDPNFHEGQSILIEKFSYIFDSPNRFDIVVFSGTDEPEKYFIKRIIGLPGEVILLSEGDIYLVIENENGKEEKILIDEPYLSNKNKVYSLRQIDGTRYAVPEGKYFVLGDNRDGSFDSRTWKNPFVPKKNIVGKYYFTLL